MNRRSLYKRFAIVIGMIFISLTWVTPSSAFSSTQITKTLLSNTAVITNSGSTNTCAYVIHVFLTFNATYTTCKFHQGQGHLSRILTENFFHDIEIAQPLNALPHKINCIKSKSFGAKTYIEYGTQKSPDVSCAVDPIGEKLANDANAIRTALNFNTLARHSLLVRTPQ
jgi:hypothetical protein